MNPVPPKSANPWLVLCILAAGLFVTGVACSTFAAGEAFRPATGTASCSRVPVRGPHGFEAVWTPERHFHAFGGRTRIRRSSAPRSPRRPSGSTSAPARSWPRCTPPCGSPRSGPSSTTCPDGRVGISFAAGWHATTSCSPVGLPQREGALPGMIDTVQRLWRRRDRTMDGHDGGTVHIRTLPRPVQPELPVWLTSPAARHVRQAGYARDQPADPPPRSVRRRARANIRATADAGRRPATPAGARSR